MRYAEEQGGLLTMRDFADHTSDWVEAAETTYRGYRVLESPPNSQGIGALMMLNLLEGYEIGSLGRNSPEYLHLCLEAKKLAFADLDAYLADPDKADVPQQGLLAKEYADERRESIDPERAATHPEPGKPQPFGNTDYLCTADSEGNLVSLIHSVFHVFGSGHGPEETGFVLHSRGAGFSLQRGHPNCVAPHKRPFQAAQISLSIE